MKRVLALLCCCLGIISGGPAAWATRGDLLASFNFLGAGFSLDSARHRMLITDNTNNKLVVVDTRTLQQVGSAVVGTSPIGVALSPDGSSIYVANSGSQSISVLDADTLTPLRSIATPYAPYNVAVGRRLYATPGSTSSYQGIMQFDTSTGQYLGQFDKGVFVYYCGMLQISPDQNTLYFANVGLSPGTLAKFDVSTDTPALLWSNQHGALGSNGQDLTLSHSGDAVYYSVGGGNSGYTIAKIRTSDMSIQGYLNTGAYPTALALSPDDKIAYTISTTGRIDIFDTTTFANIGKIVTSSSMDYYGGDLMVDDSGTRVFFSSPNSSNSSKVCVYETGFAPNVTPPQGVSVEISSPTTGPTYTTNTATIDLAGKAYEIDSSGATLGWGYLNTIAWSNNKGGSGTGTCSNSLVAPASWSLKGVTLRGGDNIITVTATDMWGNIAKATITVRVPPALSVSISEPTSAPTFSTIAGSIAMSGSASNVDSSGAVLNWAKLSTITWSSDRGGSGNGTFTNSPSSPTKWSIPSATLQGGDNVITVNATDVWGNSETAIITVNWSPGSIGAAKKQRDGTRVNVNNAVVTATNIVSGSVFVESADRSSGIRLVTNQALSIGDKLAFTGTISRVNGEYQISNVSLQSIDSVSPIKPIYFTSSCIGNDRSESLNYLGLNSTGMLVKTSGKVTGTVSSQQLFYLEDGGMYKDGIGPDPVSGLRVHVPSGVTIPWAGRRIAVTGILRVEKLTLTAWGEVNGDWYPSGTTLYVPSVWARSATDVMVLPR